MSEFLKRLIVAMLFIPALIAILYFKGIWLFALCFIVASLASFEYNKMMREKEVVIPRFWAYLNPVFFLLFLQFKEAGFSVFWVAAFIALAYSLCKWDEQKSMPAVFASLFGTLYTALFPALLAIVGLHYENGDILLALIVMVWIVDSVAYFIGMRFGKHREIFLASPKKSLEGFIGGMAAAAAVALALYFTGLFGFNKTELALLALAGGVFGQFGDLVESMLKRYCCVKDSSKLIPGHGGFLDRADSVLYAVSFLYAALLILRMI